MGGRHAQVGALAAATSAWEKGQGWGSLAPLGTTLTNVADEVVGAVGLPSNHPQGLGHHETVLQEGVRAGAEQAGLLPPQQELAPLNRAGSDKRPCPPTQ